MFPIAAGWLPPAPPTPPPPEGLHVLVIHFPIALLLVAPLFILLGALVAARWQGFAVVAALLMVLGTAGTWVAVSTGETARDVIEEASDEALDVMEHHEELGEWTRNVYTGLTAAYVIFVLLTLVWSPIAKAAIRIPLGLIFLALSAGAALYLAGTAHLGGRLVHEYGIRATLAETARPASGKAREKDAEHSGEKSVEENAEEARESAAEQTAEEGAEKTGEEAGEKAGGEVGEGHRDATEAPAGEVSSGKEPAGAAEEPRAEEQQSGETPSEPTAPAAEETPAEQSGEATMEPPDETPGTDSNAETPNTETPNTGSNAESNAGSNAGSDTEPPRAEPAEEQPAPAESAEPPAQSSP